FTGEAEYVLDVDPAKTAHGTLFAFLERQGGWKQGVTMPARPVAGMYATQHEPRLQLWIRLYADGSLVTASVAHDNVDEIVDQVAGWLDLRRDAYFNGHNAAGVFIQEGRGLRMMASTGQVSILYQGFVDDAGSLRLDSFSLTTSNEEAGLVFEKKTPSVS
ncbi:MAG: hypothetical protein AAFV53_19845, partial [Myxococcota bacterium]